MIVDSAIAADIARDEELAELRAEVSRLQGLLTGRPHESAMYQLRGRLDLPPCQGWLLAMMHALNGETLTMARAIAGMPSHGDPEERTANDVAVHIHRLRSIAPNRDMIQNIRAAGYRLTPEGVEWVNTVLERAT